MSSRVFPNMRRRSRSLGAEVYIKSDVKRAEVTPLFQHTWGLRARKNAAPPLVHAKLMRTRPNRRRSHPGGSAVSALTISMGVSHSLCLLRVIEYSR